MSRPAHLFLALLVPLLLAAAPPEPVTARLGAVLTLRLPLPKDAVVAGYPDLSPFALRTPPRAADGELLLELVPLRPGRHLFPPLPLRDSGNRPLQTEPLVIDVTAPEPPADLQPLKELPVTTSETTSSPLWPGTILLLTAAALAGLWRRRRRRHEPEPISTLDRLARDFAARDDHNDPRWQTFRYQLQRLRFAPLPPDDAQIDALRTQFATLCRKEQA